MDNSWLRRRLLTWFDNSQRNLPWRRNRNVYRIWVSEVMLQQTTVAAVIPCFQKFIKAFPNVRSLARADEQVVLKHWEGLGYYRRARHLHQAAKLIVEQYGGRMPRDPAVWNDLPGVGQYILGAVVSQAFDLRFPIVEANSQRVLCRLFCKSGDPTRPPMRRWLWEQASELLPQKRVGDFNQAIMELGALVCTPTKPSCAMCPVSKGCAAYKRGLQNEIPARPRAKKLVEVNEVAFVVWRGRRVLVAQRLKNATRWASMWEFPHFPIDRDELSIDVATRLLKRHTGITGCVGSEVAIIRHGVTRFRITLTALEVEYASGRFASADYQQVRWLSPTELIQYPTSSPQRRLFEVVGESARQRRLY